MTLIEVWNSSDCLVFRGSEEEYQELKANHLINDSDRLVIVEDKKPIDK